MSILTIIRLKKSLLTVETVSKVVEETRYNNIRVWNMFGRKKQFIKKLKKILDKAWKLYLWYTDVNLRWFWL